MSQRLSTREPRGPTGASPELRAIGRLVAAHRWLVLGVTLVVGAAFTAYAFLATPIYRATAVLAPTEVERSIGGLSGALGQLSNVAALAGVGGLDQRNLSVEESLAVLRSNEFLGRFIADHDLLPRLFPSAWDAAHGRWKSRWFRPQPTMARGVDYFDARILNAERDRRTGLVRVSVDWRDREEAAAWANELVARVNAEMRARAMAKALAYAGFLEKELTSTELVETRAAISRLIEEQIKQRMVASVTQEYAFQTVGHAYPPDAEDFVRPQRILLTVGGVLLGLLLGLGAAFVAALGGSAPARANSED